MLYEEKKRIRNAVIVLAIGAAVNLALSLIKLYVGLRTNSITILLDATNSFFDILSCAVTIVAFLTLFKQRSQKNIYGYGRAEYVASFVIAVIVIIVGAVFMWQSAGRLIMPTPVWFSWQNFSIMIAALVIKIGMGVYYKAADSKLHSTSLRALALDSFLDVGITAAAVISFTLSPFLNFAIDAIFGIALSVVIIAGGVKLMAQNMRALVGRGATEDEKREIRDIISAHEDVRKVGEILLHDYGYKKSVGSAQVVFAEMSAARAAELSAELCEEIRKRAGISICIALNSAGLEKESDDERAENEISKKPISKTEAAD